MKKIRKLMLLTTPIAVSCLSSIFVCGCAKKEIKMYETSDFDYKPTIAPHDSQDFLTVEDATTEYFENAKRNLQIYIQDFLYYNAVIATAKRDHWKQIWGENADYVFNTKIGLKSITKYENYYLVSGKAFTYYLATRPWNGVNQDVTEIHFDTEKFDFEFENIPFALAVDEDDHKKWTAIEYVDTTRYQDWKISCNFETAVGAWAKAEGHEEVILYETHLVGEQHFDKNYKPKEHGVDYLSKLQFQSEYFKNCQYNPE